MNKKYILKKSYDIEKLLKDKKSVGSKYYVIYYKFSESEIPQIAISVSKRVGNAVTRNHEKRIIREIIKNYITRLNKINMLFVVKPNSLDLTYINKKEQIDYLLKKMLKQGEKNEKF